MGASFDILRKPWVPVLDAAGQKTELGLLETLERAHELQAIQTASPMEEYSVYRFLIVFLMDALRPEDGEEDIGGLLEAEQFASRVDYGGYTVPLAFLGRHAAGNAAMAVELALALCRKGADISDEAILDGIAAVDNRCSIRVLSQRPLVILDACRTPQQAAALLRVLNMAKVRHMSAIIGLTEEEGAEAFFSALETGLSPEEQKKDKSTMPGMSESPFDKVYLVTPTGVEEQLTRRLTEKAKYHFDAQLCTSLDEAVQLANANTRRGLLVCGSEAAALEAAELLAKA